jgi:hypothetical protein
MADLPLKVDVTVDQRTLAKILTFSRPVTSIEASNYLFGNASRSGLLKPTGAAAAGHSSCYLIDTREVDIIMQLRPDVRDAIVKGGVIRSVGKPMVLPAWIPVNIKQDIYGGKLQNRVTHYKGQAGWGDIIVWKDSVSVQVYQEFPESESYYSGITSDGTQARLLHYAYTQYNKDMRYFVETKGISPENARSEIRRINEEVFKLILEGAVALLSAGAGITQVNNTMRMSAKQVSDAARRSPRIGSSNALKKIRPVNGKVNVGGGTETPHMTNLNPAKGVGGGPEAGIPNHVRGSMEQMDVLFEPNSVDFMMSSKLRYGDVNWDQATRAAAKVMRPGGKVEMNIWCYEAEKKALEAAFKAAGFKNVTTVGDSVGTMLNAVW